MVTSGFMLIPSFADYRFDSDLKLPIYTWKLYIFSESGLCKGESVEGRDNEL